LLSWTIPTLVAITLAFTPALSSAAPRGGGSRGGYGGGNRGGYGDGYRGYGRGPYIGIGIGAGYPYNGGYGYGYNGYDGSPYNDYPTSTYAAPDTTTYGTPTTAPSGNYQSFYPTSNSTAASVSVTLSASGEVTFGSYQTSQSAGPKAYETPALNPGKTYSYDIRARWMDNGREVTQTRSVMIHAGDRVNVDFTRSNG